MPSSHRSNAQRRQDLVLHILLVADAGDGFDDSAQQAIAEVGIGVPLAGIEVEFPAQHDADDVLGLGRRRHLQQFREPYRLEHRIERLVAVPAAAMLQQLPDGDPALTLVKHRTIDQVRFNLEPVEDAVVQRQPATFGQLEDRHRRNGFGDAGDAKQAGRGDAILPLRVRNAEPRGIGQATVIRDRHRSSGNFVPSEELRENGLAALPARLDRR